MQLEIPDSDFLSILARDTWNYLRSDETTANRLPCSWWAGGHVIGDQDRGPYANPAEIGLYALCWLAAHDLGRPWSPSWAEAEHRVTAILEQLRAWQTGSQEHQPHGPNAYQNSVFYWWYWIYETPPVVSGLVKDHLVPALDNAWLAASLITIRAYAEACGQAALAQVADAILSDMNFQLWYDPTAHCFFLGATEAPKCGVPADYYSNENRIINFTARALGHLSADEFHRSLRVLEGPSGDYNGITVERMSWDGSYFTYVAPALFICEMGTPYAKGTVIPATQAQIAYAQNEGYKAWGLSDCFDVEDGGYVEQEAPPGAKPCLREARPGLVTPYAAGLALTTPLASEAVANLRTISTEFPCARDERLGFRDAVMANPSAPDYKKVSYRFSSLDQEWIFLSIANRETGFIWRYFYRDRGVRRAHTEMYGRSIWCEDSD
jgi:hypothetical protein